MSCRVVSCRFVSSCRVGSGRVGSGKGDLSQSVMFENLFIPPAPKHMNRCCNYIVFELVLTAM